MSFKDQVKARALQMKQEEAAQEEEQKRSEAIFLSNCKLAWKDSIRGDWPEVEWFVSSDFQYGVNGYGQFEYEDHTWIVQPNFEKKPLTWTWHESTIHAPYLHKESGSSELREDLLTALVNPPKKPEGFQYFD